METFIQHPDGRINNYLSVTTANAVHIVPGSFNPLHAGHRRIFEYASRLGPAYYEISVDRIGKEFLGQDELDKRLSQFLWYAPVIVTNQMLLCNKVALPIFKDLKRIGIHIGADTAKRLIQMNSINDFMPNVFIYVYERIIDGMIHQINEKEKWPNMILVNDWGRNVAHLASSQIRKDQ